MSDHPFRWVPSLQHISAVKINEILWKRIEDREEIQEFAHSEYASAEDAEALPDDLWNVDLPEHLKTLIDQLPLPRILRMVLKTFPRPMSREAMYTVISAPFRAIMDASLNLHEAIRHFTKFRWNNEGIVDLRGMLESYAESQAYVSVRLWKILSYYCIEKEVLRLGQLIPWHRYSTLFSSFDQVYWFRRIYGVAPTRRMFRPCYFERFSKDLQNEECMDLAIVDYLAKNTSESEYLGASTNISAITFCKNNLRINEPRFMDYIKEAATTNMQTDRVHYYPQCTIYLMRIMTKEDCLALLRRFKGYFILELWPWYWFIDTWIGIFEDADFTFFERTFERIGQVHEMANEAVYVRFAGIWEVFYRRFKGRPRRFRPGFAAIFFHQDLHLCSVMFEKMAPVHREFLVVSLGHRNYRVMDKFVIGRRFYNDFARVVLNSDKERKLFRKVARVAPDSL